MDSNLFWYLKLFRRYKFLLFLAFLGTVLEGVSYSGLSFVLKDLVDRVLIEKNFQLLYLTVSLLLAFGFSKQLGFLTSEILYKFAVADISKRLRFELYSKLVNLPVESFLKKPLGDWVGRLTNDVKSFKDYSEGFGIKIVREFLTSLFLIGVLLYFDWKLFLLFLTVSPFLGLAFSSFGRKRKKYSRYYQESFAEFINFATDIFDNFESLKFFKKTFLNSLTKGKIAKLFKAEFKTALYTAGYLSAIEILGYIFASVVLLYGGYRVIEGELSAGTFISFLGTLFLLYNSLQSLQRTAVNYRALEPVISRIREVLEKFETEKGGNKRFEKLTEGVKTEKLTYPKNGKILKGVDLSVSKGEKILIKGPSGGGKSTLLKVLSSLYRDYGGWVYYDKTELRDFILPSLRGRIFYISQKTAVFNDTVRNNLLLVNPKATDGELRKALKLAKADFVFKLPKGLDTVVGGGGVQLSGGQRQRIALARLFLLKPEVVFLDEATSALDPKTEEEILNNILQTFQGSTIFFVSHRKGLERFFDRTLTVENGKLISNL